LILNNHNRDAIADIEGALSHLLALRLMKSTNRFVLRQMRAKIWAARLADVVQKGMAACHDPLLGDYF